MRIAPWLVAALCAAPPAHAQGVIEWSSERRLSRDDFKGRVPSAAQNRSLSWLNVEASWACDGDKLTGTARAFFDPARSWWRAAQGNIWEGVGEKSGGVNQTHVDVRRSAALRDVQLLEHEQMHFDLSEIAARRVRSRFEDLADACGDPGATERLQDDLAQIDRDLQDEQRRYDSETNHGLNAAAQDRWTQTIQQQLGPSPRPRMPAPRRRQ
jgi:hypothetical protein